MLDLVKSVFIVAALLSMGVVLLTLQACGSTLQPGQRVVKPESLAAVRSVVSNYPMVNVPEKSSEIASKVLVVVEKFKGCHLQVASLAMADIELTKVRPDAVERK